MSSPSHRARPSLVAVFLAVFLAVLVAMFAAACGGGDSPEKEGAPAQRGDGGAGARVSMKGLEFKPAELDVVVGETVTWVFDDGSTSHNVVGDGLDSPLKRSGTYRYTFEEPGTYEYRCTIHRDMKGRVVVS